MESSYIVFDKESSLVNKFVTFVSERLGSFSSLEIEREFSVGGTFADVVVFFGPSDHHQQDKYRLSAKEALFAKLIMDGSIDKYSTLETQIGPKEARKTTRSLIGSGVINACTNDTFEPNRNWGECLVLAFEAKLKDWRSAIKQAHEYKKYADYSYVVFPSDLQPKYDVFKDFCIDNGIGVIFVSDSDFMFALRSRKSSDYTWERVFAVGKLYSKKGGCHGSKRLHKEEHQLTFTR